jgi:hypothetical protein
MQFDRMAAGAKATNPQALLFHNAARSVNMFANLKQLQAKISLSAGFDHAGRIVAESHEQS